MGYNREHAVVVHGRVPEDVEVAHAKASQIFDEVFSVDGWQPGSALVSPIVHGMINAGCSFFIAPDGSKDGWDESLQGDLARQRFIDWLESQRYEDGSISLAYVEVQFHDDEGVTKIVSDSDSKRRDIEAS